MAFSLWLNGAKLHFEKRDASCMLYTGPAREDSGSSERMCHSLGLSVLSTFKSPELTAIIKAVNWSQRCHHAIFELPQCLRAAAAAAARRSRAFSERVSLHAPPRPLRVWRFIRVGQDRLWFLCREWSRHPPESFNLITLGAKRALYRECRLCGRGTARNSRRGSRTNPARVAQGSGYIIS